MARKKLVTPETTVRAVALATAMGCSGQPAEPKDRTIDHGQESDDVRKPIGKVAYAAMRDAGTKPIPTNPSYIAIKFPKVPHLLAYALSADESDPPPFPYHHEVIQREDSTVLVLYVEYKMPIGIMVRPVQEVALEPGQEPLYEPVGPWAKFTIEPEAKLGTHEMGFGQSLKTVVFKNWYEKPLVIGENDLAGPVSDEFVDDSMNQVMSATFAAPEKMTCDLSWEGCERVLVFIDGPPVCLTETASIELDAGQIMGVYPITDRFVRLHLKNLSVPED